MFENDSVVSAQGRIRNALAYSLKEKYGKDDPELVEKILKIHGMAKENFDFIHNIEEVISKGITDTSIDQNANKNETTVAGIIGEVTLPINKLIGYRYLYRKMKELYGKKEAKRLSGLMYDMTVALSDSGKIMSPYCFSIDASRLVLEGRPFGQLQSAPPKRLSSYISALNETTHQLSNHLAGAVAIGSMMLDVSHILMFKEEVSFEQLKTDKKTRKYIENCFQTFVHSVNHLSRNSQECPFSNVTICDRPKLESLISDEKMGWYFEGADKEYVIEYINEVQNIFLDFFDRGDVLSGGAPFRFPILTINATKTFDETGNAHIEDTSFMKSLCQREIYRYNIMVSEGSKFSMCCRVKNDLELMKQGGKVNSFGGSEISLGSHRVATINFNRLALLSPRYEAYKSLVKETIHDTVKILYAHRMFILDEIKLGLQPFMQNGYININGMFSTVGIIGIVEAKNTMKSLFSHLPEDTIADTLTMLNEEVYVLAEKYGVPINIEQIPGESMAVKLSHIDKEIFGEKLVPYMLYSNQFIPLWEDATVWERMDTDGKYCQLLTGGGIAHIGIGERVTPQQAYKLVEYACQSGCEHFALNSVYAKCSEGHTNFGDHSVCPECGAEIVEKYTRVVGFFTPVSSWNKTRREWEFPQRSFGGIE